MKLSKNQFDFVMQDIRAGRSVKDTAIAHLMSERQVQRIKEAGTWDRWPYIAAKARYGYDTPEYKAYLKRRGLPLRPPAKTRTMPVTSTYHVAQRQTLPDKHGSRNWVIRTINRIFGGK